MTVPREQSVYYRRSRFTTHLPRDRRYTAAHYWLLEESPGSWRVGLTRFATRMLGDIVEFEFSAAAGTPITTGADIGSIEGGQDTAVDDAIVEEITDDELEPFVGVDTWLALLGIATPFVTAVLAPAHLSDGLKALVSAVVVGVVTIVKQGLIDGDLTLPRFVNGSIQVLISSCSPRCTMPSSSTPAISSRKRMQRVHWMHRVMWVEISGPRSLSTTARLFSLKREWSGP